jgi:KRAB domain-containing zinc finger protein
MSEWTGVAVSKPEVITCLEESKDAWIIDRNGTEGRAPGTLK